MVNGKDGEDIILSDDIFFGNSGEDSVKKEVDALKEKAALESKDIPLKDIDIDESKDKVVEKDKPDKGLEYIEIENEGSKGQASSAIIKKSSDADFKKMVRSFGIDKFVTVGEDGEEHETSIDDVDVDADMAIELLKSYFDSDKDYIKKNSVSVEGVDDYKKDLINFIAKGGDPVKLIEQQTEIDKVKKYDLYLDEDAEAVIRYYYSLKGLDDETAESAITGAKARGVLTETAEKASVAITDYFKGQQDVEKKLLDEQIEAKDNAFKEYKKALKNNFKEDGYTDTLIKRAMDFSTQKVKVNMSNGIEAETYEMDRVYQQWRADPKRAVDLTLFLLDKESYLKKKLESKEIELKKKIIVDTRKAKIVRAGSTNSVKTSFDKNEENKNIIPLE